MIDPDGWIIKMDGLMTKKGKKNKAFVALLAL